MRIVWSAQAQNELFVLLIHYRAIDPDLAVTLAERAAAAAALLGDHPELGPIVPNTSWRKWRVRRAPFLQLYEARADAVEIVHVRHAASNWREER